MNNRPSVIDLLERDDYIEIPNDEFSLDKVLEITAKYSGCLVLNNYATKNLLTSKSFAQRHDPATQLQVIRDGYAGAFLVSDPNDLDEIMSVTVSFILWF